MITFSQSAVRVFLGRDHVADAVDEDLRAAARDRVEARVAQAGQRDRDAELRAACDVLDLRLGERVQVDRVALLDRAEEILVVVDREVGMVAALHEDARPTDRKRLLDLLEDDRFRQQVPLGAVARPAIEGAEVAVGDANVRVVDVAIDDERDPAGVGASRSERLCRLPDRDEILRLEQRQRLGVGDPFPGERSLENGRPSCRHYLSLDEAKVGDGVELAGVARQFHEREEAGALARGRTGSAASRSSG